MDELLFNMHETLPENAFPISTVQNAGHIQAHHISKTQHDPTVTKLPCRCISFLFFMNFPMMISIQWSVFLSIPAVSSQIRVIRTTFPKLSLIQRWQREKLAGDQTALQVHFLFFFRTFPMMISVEWSKFLSIPPVSSQIRVIRTTYPKLSVIQRLNPEIWPPEYYWFYSKICSSLSLSVFLFFKFIYSFFFNWWPLQFYRHLFP